MKMLITIIVLLLTGCAFTQQANNSSAVYSLGLLLETETAELSNQAPEHLPILLIAEATSPTWLNTKAIQYRLAYHDPARIYTYANSRWAAPPAVMLTREIRNHTLIQTGNAVVKPGDGVQADYALRVELEEFIQIFDNSDSSRSVISLNAKLIERKTRTLIAQRHFTIQQKSSTANAVGAVQAFTEASNKLTTMIINWMTEAITGKN